MSALMLLRRKLRRLLPRRRPQLPLWLLSLPGQFKLAKQPDQPIEVVAGKIITGKRLEQK
jgi:hypothetical protein